MTDNTIPAAELRKKAQSSRRMLIASPTMLALLDRVEAQDTKCLLYEASLDKADKGIAELEADKANAEESARRHAEKLKAVWDEYEAFKLAATQQVEANAVRAFACWAMAQAKSDWYGRTVDDMVNSYLSEQPSAPASVPGHVIRDVVNKLRDTAIQYHATGQLRERMREAIEPLLAPAAEEGKAVLSRCDAGSVRDAERYRYLRNPDPQPCRHLDVCDDKYDIIEGKALDSAIDAAQEGSKNG